MKITVLMENTTAREELQAEHGLSLFIEAGSRRILFDAGQSGGFWDNAEALGIDLTRVDTAVLSHGHYDHGDGLSRFFRENPAAECYVNPKAFRPHYNAKGKYIGLDPAIRGTGRFLFVEEICEIGPGLTLYPGGEVPVTTASGLQMELDGRRMPDDFTHEQYLLILENDVRVLISGCSHRGVVSLMERFRPDVFIGGFHTKDVTDEAVLQALARKLAEFPAVYYTCHCTGTNQFAVLERILGSRLRYLGTGDTLTR